MTKMGIRYNLFAKETAVQEIGAVDIIKSISTAKMYA